ncbi:hypothetical protein CYMTET_5268 [Cymbomonas tetramitiformis]|uniref:Endonuclease/exonuclease/phosphatase domain-containing protein n=1 Tax=Cymbomonas tetramitiformis TaxID=36881 RepID=A0AAE0GZH6_9CHLO|nr:hypothetical protein CYMTET_5268 [Cymbomonas tetramitiformis]
MSSPQPGATPESSKLLLRRLTPIVREGNEQRSSQNFSVLQFNVLADSLCNTQAFPVAPPACLEWEERKFLLLEELSKYGPDIICMEECDKFDEWFSPQLAALGYSGHFTKKQGRGDDGCAMFYRHDKFECVNCVGAPIGSHTQVFMIMQLKPKDGGKHIMVATTHLKATKSTEGEQMRHEQIHFIMEALSEASSNCTEPHVKVLTGDLNASPDSPKYEALVYPAMLNFQKLGFVSAYSYPGNTAADEPPFTSLKIRKENHNLGTSDSQEDDIKLAVFKYTIDFIMYSPQEMRVASLLSMPTEEEAGSNPPIASSAILHTTR